MTLLKIQNIMEEKNKCSVIAEGANNVANENEIELIKIIRENDNQEQALVTAIEIILDFLTQHGSSEEQASADLRVLA